ncbi:hypothetical protein MNBD_GAMMA09-1857 [hydrothermal vent metagenome]|uniref:Sulfotransferase n=1 Tax=hydrothermal vent metagenome TaxID=652676 RepID=A0A3B0XVK9_9ZZZZ
MAIEIRLTDQHLPVSPAFIDFLYQFLIKKTRKNHWHNQQSEALRNESEAVFKNAVAHVEEVSKNPVAQQTINRGYDLTLSIMFGALERLESMQSSKKFILVVGCPRSGGSYLTKHLFMSINKDIEMTPGVIAHDGFPDPVPFSIQKSNNAHTTLTRHMGEYIAMAELFFSQDTPRNGFTIIPKKSTKSAYYGAFFNDVLGKNAEIILTIRHPVASCISTLEKSGGPTKDNKFKVRSNIESWIDRDIKFLSGDQDNEKQDYFDCYLKYWENYHYSIVTSGLLANKNVQMVPFLSDHLYNMAAGFYERFSDSEQTGSRQTAIDDFITDKKQPLQSDWVSKGNEAVARVASMWKSFGHEFPVEGVLENY